MADQGHLELLQNKKAVQISRFHTCCSGGYLKPVFRFEIDDFGNRALLTIASGNSIICLDRAEVTQLAQWLLDMAPSCAEPVTKPAVTIPAYY